MSNFNTGIAKGNANRVKQARASLAAAVEVEKAASEAHKASVQAVHVARGELAAALVDADKDLPRVVVRSRGRYASDESGTECVVHKRTEKSLTVRSIGGEHTTQFRPAKYSCHAGEWHEYPSPKGWGASYYWIDIAEVPV